MKMIQKLIIVALLLLPAPAVLCQTPDCGKFREGKFRIADANAGGITIIERKGGYQTESNEGLKLIVRLRVRWLDNCSYELKFDKVLRNDNKIELPNISMLVKITATGDNSYTQETTSSMYEGVYRSEVTKIR